MAPRPVPTVKDVSHARTLWEEGHEPGHQVVVLGLAGTLTAVALDLVVGAGLSPIFDVCFVIVCLAVALAVRPSDFFTVGVLPPVMMLVVFTLLGLTKPEVLGHRGDSVVQVVVSGLATHAGALFLGYALCLGVLAVRQRRLGAADEGRLRPSETPTPYEGHAP